MDMIFDTADGSLTIHVPDPQPWGAILQAVVKRYDRVVDMRGVQMQLSIRADEEQIFDLHLPAEGTFFSKTDQELLATGRVVWTPDQKIKVSARCRTHAGDEVTVEKTFIAPRPAQPYASWTWQDGRWTPPVPAPDDGDYAWDEDAQAWVLEDHHA